MGSCRPISHSFPSTQYSNRSISFQICWFNKHESLEYSIFKDVALCFWCYRFGGKKGCRSSITKKGFWNWKKALENLNYYIGKEGSTHNNASKIIRKFSQGSEVMGLPIVCTSKSSVNISWHSETVVSTCASETTKVIIRDIEDKYFFLLLDEAGDDSAKK